MAAETHRFSSVETEEMYAAIPMPLAKQTELRPQK